MSLNPVRGTHDLLPDQQRIHSWIIHKAARLSQCYGFEPIDTPIFEFTEVFKRTLGESSDVVNKQMYTFPDNSGEEMTLRPEGTAGIARAFISNGLQRQTPLKYYYHGPMFRYERPQKGRQRQFHQFGVELIGVEFPQADIEVIALGYSILSSLKVMDSTTLEINTIGDSESRQAYKSRLVSYLEKYVSDLSEDSQRRLKINPLRILDSKDEGDQKIVAGAPDFRDSLNSASKDFFDRVQQGLTNLGIQYHLNSRLVRGLDYYSHCVFEFKSSALGAQDAILSGGRYDGLIELMGGKPTPGVGWAAGMERLALLIQPEIKVTRPIALIPLGDTAQMEMEKLAFQLRMEGVPVEMSYSGNLKKRLARATKAQASHAVIIGESELENGQAVVKDLDQHTQQELPLSQTLSSLITAYRSK
ncbi:MAG: histidine--tRNA ligase [Bdellovibrionales bacterium]|nr:histidine--tRNA ligase [Bdellovibrionales bacterium]